MRLVDNYKPHTDYQLIRINKIPIKLHMTQYPEVDPETREALKHHLLNIPFSFADYKNVSIHIPRKNLSLSYNINPTSSEILEYVIDDIRDHPKPASRWDY